MSYTPYCDVCSEKAVWIEYRTFQYHYCPKCKVELDNYGRRVRVITYTPEEKHNILVMQGWRYDREPYSGTEKYFHPTSDKYYSLRDAWEEYTKEKVWL